LLALLVAVGCRWSPGAPRHLPLFHLAGVALGVIYLRLAWQASHLLHLVARLVAVRRPALCVAGVALGDIYLRFTWLA